MDIDEKQIKEIALIIDEYLQGKIDGNEETLAQMIYDKILPKGSVILDHNEAQKYYAYKIIEPQIKGCLDRERALEEQLQEARKQALNLALVLGEIIKRTNERLCTFKLENKSQEFTDGYTEAIDEVWSRLNEIAKENGVEL